MGKLSTQAPGLAKTLRLPQIVALYIGAVIGSGVLLIPGLAAEKAGPASILAWLVMSILVLPMAITMGLLSARYPSSGGVSTFVRTAYGDRFGNMVGWFFLLSVPIGAPILSVTGANYIAILLNWSESQVYAAAALLLLAVLMMNVVGLHVAARVQTIVVSLIITILILAVVASIPHASVTHFTPFMPNGWLSVVQAVWGRHLGCLSQRHGSTLPGSGRRMDCSRNRLVHLYRNSQRLHWSGFAYRLFVGPRKDRSSLVWHPPCQVPDTNRRTIFSLSLFCRRSRRTLFRRDRLVQTHRASQCYFFCDLHRRVSGWGPALAQ